MGSFDQTTSFIMKAWYWMAVYHKFEVNFSMSSSQRNIMWSFYLTGRLKNLLFCNIQQYRELDTEDQKLTTDPVGNTAQLRFYHRSLSHCWVIWFIDSTWLFISTHNSLPVLPPGLADQISNYISSCTLHRLVCIQMVEGTPPVQTLETSTRKPLTACKGEGIRKL